MSDKIDFDDIEFNTFNDEDKKANSLNKKKPILKGTVNEKTARIGLKFTPGYKEDLLKFLTPNEVFFKEFLRKKVA